MASVSRPRTLRRSSPLQAAPRERISGDGPRVLPCASALWSGIGDISGWSLFQARAQRFISLARRGWFLVRPAEIVVIEDNQADVFLVNWRLRSSAISTSHPVRDRSRSRPRALCSRAAENAPRPDIILLDLNTPRSDGFEILAKLKQTPRLAKAQIAILTSSRAPADHARAASHGVRYIEKASQLQDFLVRSARPLRKCWWNRRLRLARRNRGARRNCKCQGPACDLFFLTPGLLTSRFRLRGRSTFFLLS